MWKKYNPNPYGKVTPDCFVRAFSKFFGTSWEEAYMTLSLAAMKKGYILNDPEFIKEFLLENGFHYETLMPKKNGKRVSVKSFARISKRQTGGKYLVRVQNHILCVDDGRYYDSFDSGDMKLYGYYYIKP